MGGTVMKPRGGDAKKAAEAKKKSANSAKGKLVVFSDGDEGEDTGGTSMAAASTVKTPAASSKKSTTTFAPYEEDDAERKQSPAIPATPKFELFTDDEMQSTSSSNSLALESVMRAKLVKPGLAASEAEALRRDPFKNYAKND